MAEERIRTAFESHAEVMERLVDIHGPAIAQLALQVVEAFHGERRLFVLGSGPQGAVATLVANHFQHRLSFDRPPLPVMALSHDIVLAGSLNREGAGRQYFSRQLRTLAMAGDAVLALAGSHRDESLVDALDTARQMECWTAVVCGSASETLGEAPDCVIDLKTESPPRALEATLFLGNVLCELVEKELFGI